MSDFKSFNLCNFQAKLSQLNIFPEGQVTDLSHMEPVITIERRIQSGSPDKITMTLKKSDLIIELSRWDFVRHMSVETRDVFTADGWTAHQIANTIKTRLRGREPSTDPSITEIVQHLTDALPTFAFTNSTGGTITGVSRGRGAQYPTAEVTFYYEDNIHLANISVIGNHRGSGYQDDLWTAIRTVPASVRSDQITSHIKALLRSVKVSPDYLATEDPPVIFPLSINKVFCYWPTDSKEEPNPPRYVFTTEAAAIAQWKADRDRCNPRQQMDLKVLPYTPAVPLRERTTTPEEEETAARADAKAAALAKLTPAERELLGL